MHNILIIHHGVGVGGGLFALIGLIEELKLKHNVKVLSIFDGMAVQYIRETGVEVIIPNTTFHKKYYQICVHSAAAYFSVIDFLKKLVSFAAYVLNKYMFAQQALRNLPFEYDIVYLNSAFISDWSRAAKRLGKKVVIHVREPLSKGTLGLRKTMIRRTIRNNCDHVVAITHDNSKRVGLPEITTVVYDPVVTSTRGSTVDVKTEESLKYFTYVGGMMRIKGFEQLVECLGFLRDDVKIFFLGAEVTFPSAGMKAAFRRKFDPYIRKHENLVHKLQQAKNVIYVGQADNVFSYFRKSVALISPFSKPHAALPILEAFSMGLPVIVSDIDGMNEWVDESNGTLFKNNDPLSLASAINQMAARPKPEYEAMKAAALNTYANIQCKNNSVSAVIAKL